MKSVRLVVDLPAKALEGKSIETIQAAMREITGDASLTVRKLPVKEVGVSANLLNCIVLAAYMRVTDIANDGMISGSSKIEPPAGTETYPIFPEDYAHPVWIPLHLARVGDYQWRMGYHEAANTLVMAEVE